MKAQYFGDVNDYRKFALLRLLAEFGGFRVGVCWMLTKDDESDQGGNRSFIAKPEQWRRYDPHIFDALATIRKRPTLPDLQRVEAEGLVPGVTYFEAQLPEDEAARADWHSRCLAASRA